jgi:hypothetical protein
MSWDIEKIEGGIVTYRDGSRATASALEEYLWRLLQEHDKARVIRRAARLEHTLRRVRQMILDYTMRPDERMVWRRVLDTIGEAID